MAARTFSAFPGPNSAAKADTEPPANAVQLNRLAIDAKPSSPGAVGMHTLPEELKDCVDTVASLRPHLPHAGTETAVDLAECLKDVAGAIVTALSANGRVSLRVACENRCLLPPKTAMPICLIVVELVTNSVKYSHPAGVEGQILLECRQAPDGTITVEVSDDGVGLPEGLDPMKARTLGLRLVRALAARAGARIGFRQDPLGLSFALTMPAAAPA